MKRERGDPGLGLVLVCGEAPVGVGSRILGLQKPVPLRVILNTLSWLPEEMYYAFFKPTRI